MRESGRMGFAVAVSLDPSDIVGHQIDDDAMIFFGLSLVIYRVHPYEFTNSKAMKQESKH